MNKSAITLYFQNTHRNFYFLLLISFSVILFSYPFLKYPYDMWNHLIRIDTFYGMEGKIYKREMWYLFWAEIFHFFSITDFFVRARVIHVVQTIICLFGVFVFSRVVIRNLFKDIDKIEVNYLSYWSAIIWLIIYATFSMYTHQVWVMWYSINYQVALAFFWYVTALTLILIFEKKKWFVSLFYLLQILLFSYVMLSIHPMELMYYFIYLLLLVLVFFDRIAHFTKDKIYYIIPIMEIIIVLLYFGNEFYGYKFSYNDKLPQIFEILKNNLLSSLYEIIMQNGHQLVNGFNRAYASINELMFVIALMVLVVFIIEAYKFLFKKESGINLRLLLFTTFTALLITIPLFQFTAGIASIISTVGVVNRFYYASSLFVFLPICIYYFWNAYGEKVSISKINLSVISILILTLLFSRFHSESHNYYKNVKSLVYSFDESKVGFNLSPDNIKNIGILLKAYEKNVPVEGKNVIYFARPDISLILKYVFKRNVYMDFAWNGKPYRRNLKQFEVYSQSKKVLETEIPIVFKTPDGFPEYVPYK